MTVKYCGVMNSIGKSENGFTKAMREVCGDYEELDVIGLLSVTSADLVFLQPQDSSIPVQVLQHLKNIGSFVINWTGDARDITPVYCYDYARYVDLTCFSNMRDVYNMRSVGHKSEFLQIGYDPDIYFPDNSVDKIHDIVFFGNNYGHFPLSGLRQQMVATLKQVYGDRFKAYGIGQPDGNFMSNQQGEADIYRRAKIGINLSHYDYEHYTSDRLFRMLGSGVCVLSKHYPGMEWHFVDGNQLIVWHDINDLITKINSCLQGNNSIMAQYNMQAIADRGHECAANYYTFEKMAQQIVELWKQHR